MSWRPALGLHHPSETEQLSGRTVDGAVTYIKLLKKTGTVGSGNIDITHGVTGMLKCYAIYGGVGNADGRKLPIPYAASSAVDYITPRVRPSDVRFAISTSWAGADALEDLWFIIEYSKT
tara:strand:+ start:40912 stop:41271 length:360 start_codon:yes stop_codon:yes gene_type:complete